jgi:ribosomal-protein-alanine N-acetyltransferase
MDLPQQPVYAIVPLQGPSIESERLLLRPVADSDAAALFTIRSRPEVAEMKWVNGTCSNAIWRLMMKSHRANWTSHPKEPFKSIEETREWMSTKVFSAGPSDVLGRTFNYAIVDKSTSGIQQRIIGSLSINQVDPYPEIGYAIHPDAWGKGVATEALQLLLKMWWDLPRRTVEVDSARPAEVEKAFALCEKRNVGSCRVLEKCGFKVVGDYRLEQDDLFIFALERP